jgi:hypothetical protein
VGEIFPVVAGALIGLIAMGLRWRRAQVALIAVASVAVGIAATLINGEQLFFIPIDTAIVAVCGGSVAAAPYFLGRLAALWAGRS